MEKDSKRIVLFIILGVLIYFAWLIWGAYDESNARYIKADKVQLVPFDECGNVTEEELSKYPILKSAIDANNFLKVPPDEWKQAQDFVWKKGGCIELNGSYYVFRFPLP